MYDEKELKEFDKWGVARPTIEKHGTIEDIRANLKSVNPRNWRLQGNHLIADTDLGELRQTIPTNYILTGTDENGLPTFKKLL